MGAGGGKAKENTLFTLDTPSGFVYSVNSATDWEIVQW
jgi:hypothetical protein